MQHVGDTLKAMKSNEVSPKDAALGSTMTDSTIVSSSLSTETETRVQPLTESQLISIASKLLLQPLRVSATKEKILGTKKTSDEFGEFLIQNAVIGEQDVFSVTAIFNANIPERALEAAWRRGPLDGYLKSLARLSMHKILGSATEDRTILLNDYAKALSSFSEFVISCACQWFWENDPNKFFPKIAEISSLATAIQNQMPKPKSLMALEKQKPPVRRAVREEDSASGKNRREHLLDFLKANGGERFIEMLTPTSPSNYLLECSARGLGWAGYPEGFNHAG